VFPEYASGPCISDRIEPAHVDGRAGGLADQALYGAEVRAAARVLVDVEPARLGAVRGARVRRGARAGLAPRAPEKEAVHGREEVVVAPERGEGGAHGGDGADEPGAGALCITTVPRVLHCKLHKM
jgi:hypothetical protein